MREITLAALSETEVNIAGIEVFAESWVSRKRFALYAETPRPCSALFCVCTDIRVSFCPVGGEPVAAKIGDIVYIPQGLCYRVSVEGGTANGIDTYTVNLRLTDEAGAPLRLGDAVTILTRAPDGRFVPFFARLYERRGLLQRKAELFTLLDALNAAESGQPAPYYPIRLGVEALRSEWNRSERIEKYAALCGLSEAYFYQCFRQWAGQSPVEYRNELRLGNAETMLRCTDMRIGEIAGLCGFADPLYFARCFTRRYGDSPRAYRQRHREFEPHSNFL